MWRRDGFLAFQDDEEDDKRTRCALATNEVFLLRKNTQKKREHKHKNVTHAHLSYSNYWLPPMIACACSILLRIVVDFALLRVAHTPPQRWRWDRQTDSRPIDRPFTMEKMSTVASGASYHTAHHKQNTVAATIRMPNNKYIQSILITRTTT